MKKRALSVFLLVALCISMLSASPYATPLSGNLGGTGTTASTLVPTISASPSGGKVVSLLSGNIYEFASDYERYKAMQYYDASNQFAPDPVTISWASEEGALYYTFLISTNADLSDATSFVTLDKSISLNDLFMGTHYYYRVIAHFTDRVVKSKIFDFETAYLTRTVDIDGLSNTRDIGGYYTADGAYRIRQGLVYRGGLTETVTEEGRAYFLYTLGIKTDLDLRGVAVSPFGDAVNHVSVSAPHYMGTSAGILAESYKQALITEIKTFADPSNYPIYVHCSLGRDRTGTLCFLISALCGVGEEELYLDYEISWFSERGCYGGYSPKNHIDKNFTPLYQYIATYPVEGENPTLADRTEAFLKEYLGITQEEIDTIRSILLEEVIK